jgi:hypothetical protein
MNLSLSTYQFDSRDCAKLNGTTKGTNFTFDDTQRKFQFCMFDRAEGRDSEIPHTGDEYARSIAKWMSEQPSQLAEFHTFMAQVDHGVIGEDLLHPLRLFRVRTGDDESLNGEQLVAAVEFTAKRARGEAREALFDLAAQAALWTALSGSGEQLSIVFRFLSEWLDERTSRSTQLAIAETWVRCFENIRLANRWQALSALSQVRAEIARRAPECERAISENILSDEETIKIGTAAASIPNDADMALGSIMTEVLRAAKSRGAAPAWECPAVHSILSACRTRALRKVAGAAALLRSFDGDAGGIAVVCSTLLNTAGDGQLKIGRDAILLGEALLDVIADKPAAVCASVYRALDNSETWGVLFGHWYASLAKHPSRRQLYNEYRDKVLAHAPRFDRVARGNIAHSFAEQLDPKIRAEQAFAWVQSGEIDLFSRETQAWCLETVLPAIRLSRETAASLTAARELAARGRQLGLAFTPDRPWLRELIEQVADARTTIRSLGLEHLPSSLRQLGEADYLEFLRSFLRPALILATNDTEHETCIRGTLLFDQRTTFGETYCAAISASGNALLPTPAVLAALKFWLRTSTGTSIDGLQGFVQPAKDALTARLAAMPREEFEAFQSELAADKDLSPEGCAQWLRIQGQVERHNRTILARLGGVFWRNRTQEKIGK